MNKTGLSFALVCVLTIGTFIFYLSAYHLEISTSRLVSGTFVIDAGHGGEDGGAVSPTGNIESHINLSIAQKLEDILALCGTPPEMLRRENISLHEKSANTLHQKKVSDLHRRASMVEHCPDPVLLSIHQNSYPDFRYHGAQAFYAKGETSRKLAEHIQTTIVQNIDRNNHRTAKRIPDSVYLLNHVTCPAVLIECGFLSNPEEDSLLQCDSYQRKLALALASALLTFQN